MQRLRYWQQPDGTFSIVAPLTNDEKDKTPCFARNNQGSWYYSRTSQSAITWFFDTTKLPKEIQLSLFLTGEE